ncbi:MAG: winged helix-turn-helix transcriptional regulator [Clostridia bacterium]|nr:winged helix-turn-helix transcriptional regulator [Clostridia bacterium]
MGNKLPVRPPRPPHCGGKPEHPSRVINEISRLFAAKMRESENEMTQESVRLIIIHLAHEDGVTQLDLVQKTHLSPPTVSLTVKKLEKLGYISRVPDTVDQRAVRVFLTEKGRELDNASRSAIDDINKILTQNISPEEIEILLPLLRRMRDNLLNDLMCDEGEQTHK